MGGGKGKQVGGQNRPGSGSGVGWGKGGHHWSRVPEGRRPRREGSFQPGKTGCATRIGGFRDHNFCKRKKKAVEPSQNRKKRGGGGEGTSRAYRIHLNAESPAPQEFQAWQNIDKGKLREKKTKRALVKPTIIREKEKNQGPVIRIQLPESAKGDLGPVMSSSVG